MSISSVHAVSLVMVVLPGLHCSAPPGYAGSGEANENSGGAAPLREQVKDSNRDWHILPADDSAPYYWDVWVPPLATAAGVAILESAVRPPKNERWVGNNDFDDGIRHGLEGSSRTVRDNAATASDALFGAIGLAVFADRWLARAESPLLVGVGSDITWFFANDMATRVLKVSAGRQRPFVESCESNSDHVSQCDAGRDKNASFYSGHASGTATLAGLLCSRHHDPTSLDGLWCLGGVGGSLATGLLRVTADQHWTTDVITGWASGALFGFVFPTYVWPGESAGSRSVVAMSLQSITPRVDGDMIGLQYEVRF